MGRRKGCNKIMSRKEPTPPPIDIVKPPAPPEPPKRPLARHIRQGLGTDICPKCGSTVERLVYSGIRSVKKCIHPECNYQN